MNQKPPKSGIPDESDDRAFGITGHKTLSEIERYTREAERARLARTASEKVVQAFGEKSEA